MPSGLDLAYWDQEKGAVKWDALNSEIAALKTAKAEWDNAKSVLPESPDKYEVKLPEGFQLPDGMTINADDPRLPEVRKLAHENGFTQKQFESLLKMDATLKQAEAKQMQEALTREQGRLGPDGGKARIDAVVRGLTAHVGEEGAKHLVAMLVSANQVQSFETLLGKMAAQGAASGGYQPGQGGVTKQWTEEEWSKLSAAERFTAARQGRAA